MKFPLKHFHAAAVALALALALVSGVTLVAPAADNKSVPKPPPGAPPPSAIDPVTGLPLPPLPPWIDPNWKDPDKILAEVVYDGLPIGEVVQQLRLEFKGQFDVLIPNGWQDPHYPGVSLDPQSATIRMQLKNVRASEVFNAMNLVFEAEQTPYRWELKLNGNRPTAMLRVLPQFLRIPTPEPSPPPQLRMIYFVGDLIDDTKPGGMTMDQLVKTVSDVYKMSYGDSKGVIQFHKDAQLLIVNGTGDQIEFIQQTLSALRDKARRSLSSQPKPAEFKAKTEDAKTR